MAQYQRLRQLPRQLRLMLQRQWQRSLIGVAVMMALGQTPALANTLTVTTNNPAIVNDGNCSLIEAINAANSDTAANGCPAGSGVDVIELPANSTHSLTVVNSNLSGDNGLPVITSTITIEGHGSTISRASSAPDFRILAVDSTGNLSLKDTTVSGGATGSLTSHGGGVFNFSGSLSLTHSTVSGNSASGYGGGVQNSGSLSLSRGLISGNTALAGAEVRRISGTITANNFNLFGHSGLSNAQAFFNFTPGASDITATSNGANPTALTSILNTTLANNGGATQTLLLKLSSPALDVIPQSDCSTTDQRGVARPQGIGCDIGAVEFQSNSAAASRVLKALRRTFGSYVGGGNSYDTATPQACGSPNIGALKQLQVVQPMRHVGTNDIQRVYFQVDRIDYLNPPSQNCTTAGNPAQCKPILCNTNTRVPGRVGSKLLIPASLFNTNPTPADTLTPGEQFNATFNIALPDNAGLNLIVSAFVVSSAENNGGSSKPVKRKKRYYLAETIHYTFDTQGKLIKRKVIAYEVP